MLALGGTFVVGWTSEIVDALKHNGIRAVGPARLDDPFALLIHRAKAITDGTAVVCLCSHDFETKHPHVDRLLEDLAELLVPKPQGTVVLDVDPHEFFAKRLDARMTFHDTVNAQVCSYMRSPIVRTIQASACVVDTPAVLRSFLAGI